ncbi:MAG: energy-coupling factor transporter ATPase [Bacillota bacterium]|nr:energy-coupling factor transporter ATPase [Bacillota bacterium]
MKIKLTEVSHVYLQSTPQETVALKNINLELAEGKIIGIIGETGSGKSTLIQTMNGLIKPTCGNIMVGAVDITQKKVNLATIRQQVGIIFQYPEYQLFEDTVANDVAFGPRNMGLQEEEVDNRVTEALKLVGLDIATVGESSPLTLSGGQKRRVAIAGVLAMRPRVLVLDEPTAALDPKGRKELLNLLNRLKEDQGITIVIVTHSMDEVAQLADELIVLNQGQVFLQGTPAAVFSEEAKLAKIGLAVPQITQLLLRLKAKGLLVNTNVFKVEEAVKEIIKARGASHA